MEKRYAYDPKCYELAVHFTQDTAINSTEALERIRKELAQAIQDAAEEHVYCMLNPMTEAAL